MNPRPKITKYGVPFAISYYFDNRRRLDNHPDCGSVLLNVFDRQSQKRSYIGLNIYCTADVFEALTGKFTKVKAEDYKGKQRLKPLPQRLISQLQNDNLSLNGKLKGLMSKAQELNNFDTCKTIAEFKEEINHSLSYTYNEVYKMRVKELEKNEQWGTKAACQSAYKALIRFKMSKVPAEPVAAAGSSIKYQKVNAKDVSKARTISFYEITADFLKEFHNYLELIDAASPNTIANYMTEIKTIYRIALDSGLVKLSNYPFGRSNNPLKKKYQVQREQIEKPVLSAEDWTKLMNYSTPFPARQKALDMFKLSYALHGANTNDMCKLLKTDITETHVRFFRKKTKKTSKQLVKRSITRDETIDFLFIKYAAPAGSPYVLDLLKADQKLGTEKTHKTCKFINRNFNRALVKISDSIGIPRISMMWARHQMATHFRDNGGTLEQLNITMGHKDMKTTKVYDHSLPSKKIQDLTKNMNKGLNINQ